MASANSITHLRGKGPICRECLKLNPVHPVHPVDFRTQANSPVLPSRRKSGLLSWIVCFAICLQALVADDVDRVGDRLAGELLSETVAANSEIANLLSTLGGDGRWPDIDYAETGQNWDPINHLDRMLKLARAFNQSGHGYEGAASVEQAYLRALDGWVADLPTASNWFKTEIGGPYLLVQGMLLMEASLSPIQVTYASTATGAAGSNAIGGSHNVPGTSKLTGQNLVWYFGIRIFRGCVENNAALVAEGFAKIQGEVSLSNLEGIRQDRSFMQHGRLLSTGSYGSTFGRDVANFITVSDATRFAFSTAQVDVFSSYILEHFQWLIQHRHWNFGAVGRAISRTTDETLLVLDRSLEICADMIEANVARAGEFADFRDRLSSDSPTFLDGNRHYWIADLMSHQRPDFYSSVRMQSTRTVPTESLNGENRRGFHLGNGVFIYGTTGDEYVDIFPVWDWRRLPGVSSRQSSSSLPSAGFKDYGKTDFVGGVSDGVLGVAAYDQDRDQVVAKKSWFFFEGGIVALGAGVEDAGGLPVYTSVNQSLWRTDVSLPGGLVAARGQRELTEPTWVHHDGIGYVFPDTGSRLTLKADGQSGSWREIDNNASSATVTKDVFSLWFDHGTDTGDYEYIVVPAKTAAEMAEYAANLSLRTLVNSTVLQAVTDTESLATGATFFRAGVLSIEPGLAIRVDGPCIVLIRRTSDAELEIHVSSPLSSVDAISLEVSLELRGSGAGWDATSRVSTVDIALPTGPDRGRTVSATYTVLGPGDADFPPAAPSALDAVTITDSRIDLSWADNSPTEAGFEIEARTDSSAFETRPGVPAGVTTASITGLEARTEYTFRVRAINAAGASGWSDEVVARTFAAPGSELRKEATADASVRGGSSSGENYGSAQTILIKDTTNSSYRRDAFIQFDLSEVAGPVEFASLRLTVIDGGDLTVEFREVADDSWTEAVTWSTRPGAGALLGSLDGFAPGDVVELDVTAFVNAQLAGDKVVSLELRSNLDDTDETVTFGSRDHPTALARPFLVIPASGPEVGLEHPPHVALVDGVSAVEFAPVAVNDFGAAKTFRIVNTGRDSLDISGFTASGVAASDFVVDTTDLAATIDPGGSSHFSVRFAPSGTGTRSTTLHLFTNDADEGSFDVVLSGQGRTALALYQKSALDAGLAGEDSDYGATPFDDGLPNLVKYAFNLELSQHATPSQPTSSTGTSGLPALTISPEESPPTWRYEYSRRVGSGLVYKVWQSADLSVGSWTELTDPSDVQPINDEWERVSFEAGTGTAFFLKVEVALPE